MELSPREATHSTETAQDGPPHIILRFENEAVNSHKGYFIWVFDMYFVFFFTHTVVLITMKNIFLD